MRFVLASASPRRAELLTAAGFDFEVDPVDVDERQREAESPVMYADRVARLKVAAGVVRHPHRVVVAADTIVVLNHRILGKPTDAVEAGRMLRLLNGRSHDVLTGVAVALGAHIESRVERTTVWFKEISEEDLRWYVSTGEPMGKAGAYAIQGLASRFVPRIDGSYSNVVGLPVATLVRLLEEVGRPARQADLTDS